GWRRITPYFPAYLLTRRCDEHADTSVRDHAHSRGSPISRAPWQDAVLSLISKSVSSFARSDGFCRTPPRLHTAANPVPLLRLAAWVWARNAKTPGEPGVLQLGAGAGFEPATFRFSPEFGML